LNRGYGAALRSGFSSATKDWVFYTDGDGQYDVADLPDLVAEVSGVDVVNGQKISRSDCWYRIWIGKAYAALVQDIFDLPIKDIDCDFRLMRSSLLKQLDLISDSGSICVELVSGLDRLGARFREVPVLHYSRQFGKSEFFQLSRIIRTVYQLIQLRNRMNREEKV
jgi:glycosyltransferase involved in cell wall biosynthesis